MSQDELVGAYIEGSITRRTLIRRLVAAGVSLGAATAYAHHLAPKAAAKGAGPNEYPRVKLRILSETTAEIAKDQSVDVRVKSADPCELTLETRGSSRAPGLRRRRSGYSSARRRKEGSPDQVSDFGELKRKQKSTVKVQAISDEGIYNPVVASKEKELEG